VSIDAALKQLDAQIEEYGHGTPQQPEEHTVGWFMLRALDCGRTLLLRMKQLEAHGDPAAAERYYLQCTKTFKLTAVPPPVEVVREKLPA
jgi:hypothetical protein